MHPLAIFAVINALPYLFIFYISGPPTIPGSAGVFAFIFFALVGQVLGALVAYLAFVGLNPDLDLEVDEAKTVVMILGSVIGAVFFVTLVYYIIGDGNAAHAMEQALGNTTGVKVFGFVAFILTLLLMIPMALTSPFIVFFTVIGLIKLSIFYANRPVAMDAVSTGKVFDIDPAMRDLQDRTEYTPPALVRLIFPGVATWYVNTQTYWNNKIAEKYQSGIQAAEATRSAYKAAHRDGEHRPKDPGPRTAPPPLPKTN